LAGRNRHREGRPRRRRAAGPGTGALRWGPLEPVVVSNKDFVANVGNVRENDVGGGSEFLDLVAVLHGTDEG